VGKKRTRVKLGVEVFLEKHLDLVKAEKVGLITNSTGTDRRLVSTIDLFAQNSQIELVALYSPEHGIRGDRQAGVHLPFYKDDQYDLPVFSLYGQTKKQPRSRISDSDELMRSFDTVPNGKRLTLRMVDNLDILVFDIQDVGTRIYTYVATMAYSMEACAEYGKKFLVLDRPNPINGTDMEGPVLEYPEYSTFVGLYPIPVRHGMTVGELALLFNEKYLKKKADLTVVTMEGWQRDMWHDETALPWIAPSPNMPSLATATVYPGQVFLEGTNISEGRGTTQPFEVFGAPWIDGFELTRRLRNLRLPGILFREVFFTPSFSKYRGQFCSGAQLHITNRKIYRPVETALHIIQTAREIYPEKFVFHENYFDRIIGNFRVREELQKGRAVNDLLKKYESEIASFAEERQPFLLY